MKLFGLTIERNRPAVAEKAAPTTSLEAVPQLGWMSTIWEPFTGAWQRNILPKTAKNILAFSAVYACLSLIAGDISKLRIKLTTRRPDGTWQEVTPEDTHGNAAAARFLAILKKPNEFQTRVQFVMDWITAKLAHGNAYALKERGRDGAVEELYLLDSRTTYPLVNGAGEVFYQLQTDYLSGIDEATIVPASEIIHDRMVTFWHPLVGVSPIHACGQAAMQGLSIQGNSEKFFANMSRPSGVLTAPGKISDETSERIKKKIEDKIGGENIGRMLILGDGLTFEPMTIPANDAQLIEQLRWTVEDVARCFHVPPYKLGLNTNVTFANAGQLDQDYYSQCLQTLIESMEALLDEGLELPPNLRTEFDLDGLLRMDPLGLAEANAKRLGSGELSPNEARIRSNLAPVQGGERPFMQQQMWQISALAGRAPPDTAPPSPPAPSADQVARAVADTILPAIAARGAKEDDAAQLIDFAAAIKTKFTLAA